MPAQPVLSVNKNRLSAMRLPRDLSSVETWGFGLTSHISWISTVPVVHAALGPKAIFVWLPGIIVGILLNLQVQGLGKRWSDISGGTPNYAARLLSNYPGLARYVALGYFIGWVCAPAIYAIVLTDLIEANLQPLGIACPKIVLKIGFTAIAFVVAFSGTRALGILHTFFILPAFGFLVVFCIQGIGWLALSPDSPGFFPTSWSSLSFAEWAKWYFVAIFAVCSCETASSFVADSRQPNETLRALSLAAWMIPPVFLSGFWVLMRLATQPGLGDSTFLNLLTAALPFWGQSASLLVTLLVAFSCLLTSATAVANCPRVLYQLALDGHLSPVFAVVSRRGVLGPALVLTFLISLLCLVWGDVTRIVMVTGTSYIATIMGLHLGLWLRRGRPEVLWPRWSLGFFIVEAVVLVVGGLAWSWQDLLLGLLLPIAILAVDRSIRRIKFAPFHPHWWLEYYQVRADSSFFKDFVAAQVMILILLVCSATAVGWFMSAKLDRTSGEPSADLLVVLLVTLAFLAVAIACWTTLPQVASLAEAREVAENLFITALDTVVDTVLVLDENGVIHQANPAAEALFGMDSVELIDRHLNDFVSGLAWSPPARWQTRSEHTLHHSDLGLRIIEATLSHRSNCQFQEYIVILRDITERKQSEEALQRSEETARRQANQLETALQDLQKTQAQLVQTEKMSSLGQLVAGVAHEINNPVNFIYGNLTHVKDYSLDLLSLIDLYQHCYPIANPQIAERIAAIDLDFLAEDLPKTLSSMRVGAERIREIVLTLRNFSRIDEADMKQVNIHEGIDSTLLILQNRLKAKPEQPGIQIVKEYGNLPLVECYAGQLNQVFMNILTNAIDALDKRDLSLEGVKNQPSTITIQTQDTCDRVKISIKDNGSGMPESVRARLFDPFFTTKPVGEGTGLGLSISYQIVVEKHGGKMQCLSTPGQGAEFLIEIPIKQN